MRLVTAFALFVLVGLLAGCATLSKSQCQTGDWRAIGQADGMNGYSLARLDEHREACSKHGVTVDAGLYTAGRDLGLRSYCTTQNASKVGLAGRSYQNVCEGEMGLSFVRIYRAASDVKYVNDQITSLQSQIKDKTEELAKPALTQQQRDSLVKQIADLNSDLSSQLTRRSEKEAILRQVMLEEQNRLNAL